MTKAYSAEELDLSSRRSIEIKDLDDQQAIVDYVYHEGQYWTAVIPLRALDSIRGQVFNFSGYKRRQLGTGNEIVYDRDGLPKPKWSFVNHVQSRFCFLPERPVRLYELGASPHGDPVTEICDLVYSIEAVGPPGVLFNFQNGMSGRMICAHRFVSMQEMVFERIVVLGYHLRESPPLPLTKDQNESVLRQSIQRSDRAGLDEPYHLFRCCGTNNCTSNPFSIIDDCVTYRGVRKLAVFFYRFPIHPRLYLRIRGLDSDPSQRHLVRDEFADFIAADSTKKRKRAVVREEIRRRRAAKLPSA